MFEHLTEKDKKEGAELMEILEQLPEEDVKQVVVYARALADRKMFVTTSKKVG